MLKSAINYVNLVTHRLKPVAHIRLKSGELLLYFLFLLTPAFALAIPAFPGAEGAGSESVGGRSGRVIEVTNLDDSAPEVSACASLLPDRARVCSGSGVL